VSENRAENIWTAKGLLHRASPDIMRNIKLRRIACSTNGDKRKIKHGLLAGNPEGKRLVGRPRFSWVDNIKMDIRNI
jgi:hypothetical protein